MDEVFIIQGAGANDKSGDVLAESVVADKELVFREVGKHAVRPVEHPGQRTMARLLPVDPGRSCRRRDR